MPSLALACRLGAGSPITLPRRVSSILNKYGATMLLPGVSGALRFGYQPGNFRESTGQTLAAADQQVGLVVDAARAPGPELMTNGDFSNGLTGWSSIGTGGTRTIVSGRVLITGGTGPGLRQGGLISGRTYRASMYARRISGTANAFVTGGGLNPAGATVTWVFKASATNFDFGISGDSSTTTWEFGEISVSELPGIHASQSTSGFQPVLRRGLVNQLLWSSDFSNAAWGKTNVTLSGSKVIENTSSAEHYIGSMNYSYVSGQVYSKAVVVEAGERTLVRLAFSSAAFPASNRFGYFNLANGTVDSLPSGVSGSIASMGDGKYLCVITRDATASATTNSFIVLVTNNNPAAISYPGDGTSGIYLHSAALFQGTVTADQIIAAGGIPVTTTAPASSANGVQSLQFDGTDDRLSLSAVPFQMSDDYVVMAGVRFSSLGFRTVFGAGNTGLANPLLELNINDSGLLRHFVRDDSGASRTASSQITAGADSVVAAVKRGQGLFVRVDSVVSPSVSATGLVATTLNAAVIGARSSTSISSFMAGDFEGAIFIKGNPTDSELLTLERFIASLQGRTI